MIVGLEQPITVDDIEKSLAKRPAKKCQRAGHKEASVCLLLREAKNSGLEILFIQRADHPDDPWSGQIAFPGGRREQQDNDLQATGQRETLEEIGLDLSGVAPASARYLGELDELQGHRNRRAASIIISCHVYLLKEASHVSANYEVQRIDWVALDYLLMKENQAQIIWPTQAEDTTSINPVSSQQTYPCVKLPYADLKLWGLTYRFVAGLLEKLHN